MMIFQVLFCNKIYPVYQSDGYIGIFSIIYLLYIYIYLTKYLIYLETMSTMHSLSTKEQTYYLTSNLLAQCISCIYNCIFKLFSTHFQNELCNLIIVIEKTVLINSSDLKTETWNWQVNDFTYVSVEGCSIINKVFILHFSLKNTLRFFFFTSKNLT